MKIETKQKLNLPELIQYVIDKGWNSYQVTSDNGVDVYFSYGNRFVICDNGSISLDDTFTVEVEEELTEDTEIHGATLVYYDELKREIKSFRYADVTSPSLEHMIQSRPDTVALAVFKGKQLIWTKEHGIPKDGALEID